MKEDLPRLPNTLLAKIAEDLQPVKPGLLPFQLMLRLAPIAVLASSVVLIILGLRADAAELGPGLTWGASVLQFGLAILLVWMAARESTPARRLPVSVIRLAVAFTGLFVAAIALFTFKEDPTVGPSGTPPWLTGLVCGGGGTIVGSMLVLVFGRVFRYSLAAQPAFAGGLYGAGAGVAVNAGWRLACPVSMPWHALGAHGAAIIVTTVLGSLAAHRLAQRAREQAGRCT